MTKKLSLAVVLSLFITAPTTSSSTVDWSNVAILSALYTGGWTTMNTGDEIIKNHAGPVLHAVYRLGALWALWKSSPLLERKLSNLNVSVPEHITSGAVSAAVIYTRDRIIQHRQNKKFPQASLSNPL